MRCLLPLLLTACTGDKADTGPADTADTGEPTPPAADPVGWVAAADMPDDRANHTATLLADGRVLVVGGEDAGRDMLDTVALYDAEADAWTELDRVPTARANHGATRLADGRVLVTGGGASLSIGVPAGVSTAEVLVFDPETLAFTAVAPMGQARSHHTATLLADGRVLVAGGAGTTATGSVPDLGDALAAAEVYDPAADTWTAVGDLGTPRWLHTATALDDGRVLAAAGCNQNAESQDSTELFDPATGTWTAAASLQTEDRLFHRAVALDDGEVLLLGGKKSNVRILDTVERYDPATDTWTEAASLSQPRTTPGVVRLESGRVLATGGYYGSATASEVLDLAELYDPEADAWTAIAPLDQERLVHTATRLADGSVLVCGGFSASRALDGCERSVSE